MDKYDYSKYPSNLEIADLLGTKEFKDYYGLTIENINPDEFTASYNFSTGETSKPVGKTYFKDGKPVTKEELMEYAKAYRNNIHDSEVALLKSIQESKDRLAGLEGYLQAGKNLSKIGITGLATILGGPYIGKGLELAGRAAMPSSYASLLTKLPFGLSVSANTANTIGQLADAGLFSYLFTESANNAILDWKNPNISTLDKIGNTGTATLFSLPFLKPTAKAIEAGTKAIGDLVGTELGGIRIGNSVFRPATNTLSVGFPKLERLKARGKTTGASRTSANEVVNEAAATEENAILYANSFEDIRPYLVHQPLASGNYGLMDVRTGRFVSSSGGVPVYTAPNGTFERVPMGQLTDNQINEISERIRGLWNNSVSRQAIQLNLLSALNQLLGQVSGRNALNATTNRPIDPAAASPGETAVIDLIRSRNGLPISIKDALALIDSGQATYEDFLTLGAILDAPFYPKDLNYLEIFENIIKPHLYRGGRRRNFSWAHHTHHMSTFLTEPLGLLKRLVNSSKLLDKNKIVAQIDQLTADGTLTQEKLNELKSQIDDLKIDYDLERKVRDASLRLYQDTRLAHGLLSNLTRGSYSTQSYPIMAKTHIKNIGKMDAIPYFFDKPTSSFYNPNRTGVDLNDYGHYFELDVNNDIILKLKKFDLNSPHLLRTYSIENGTKYMKLFDPDRRMGIKIPFKSKTLIVSEINDQIKKTVEKAVKDENLRNQLFEYFSVVEDANSESGISSKNTVNGQPKVLITLHRKYGGKLIKKNNLLK